MTRSHRRYIPFGGFLLAAALLLAGMPAIASGADLQTAREGHTSTLLPDGRVLIAGGENQSGIVGTAEFIQPASQANLPAVSMIEPRSWHTATVLDDGMVLIIGGKGSGGSLQSTELFDPVTNTFSPGPPMNVARSAHTATTLTDGRILIAGGSDDWTAEI